MCEEIKELAAELKVRVAEVEKVLKELIVKGITKAKEIIEKIKKHFFPDSLVGGMIANLNLKCEDVLAPKVCTQLREAAEKLKIKAELTEEIIKEAISHDITKAKEIIEYVRQRIVDMATHTKCTDILSVEMCEEIKELAAELKVRVAEVEKVLKELIAKGITKAKEIIEKVKKHFFPNALVEEMIANLELKCEDVLAPVVCARLRRAAEKLKVKAEMIEKIIHEAVAHGATKAKEIIEYV